MAAQPVTFEGPLSKAFAADLRKEVDRLFKDEGVSRNATPGMVLKTVIVLAMIFVPYGLLFTGWFPVWAMWVMSAVIGLGFAGVGFCVAHDAIHGAYSKNKRVNHLLGLTLDVLGGSSILWRLTHNRIHHTWTNIPGIDEDIDVSPLVRHSPRGAEARWYHRLQQWYAWPLYGLATINWAFVKDYQQATMKKIGPFDGARLTGRQWFWMIFGKLVHYGWTIAIPLLFMPITVPQFLIGYVTMHFTAGLVLGVVFQLAHVVEEAEYIEPDEGGSMHDGWHAHQLRTTANFACENRLLTWYVGGLNHQIEHHLFPRICSVHYPKLRPIVKRLAKEHGLPYYEAPSFMSGVASHFRMLKRLGRGELAQLRNAAEAPAARIPA